METQQQINYKSEWDYCLTSSCKRGFVIEAGWYTKPDTLSRLGSKLLSSAWDDLSDVAQTIIKRRIDNYFA